jgi:hypothetical protein
MPSQFRHVENDTLRRRLEKTKATVTAEDVQLIMVQSLQSFGLDVATRNDIPASAIQARGEAIKGAVEAVRADKKSAAFRHLQRYCLS